MNLGKYRKALVAAGTLVVELVALWQGAPGWLVGAAGLIGTYLVYQVPNEQT